MGSARAMRSTTIDHTSALIEVGEICRITRTYVLQKMMRVAATERKRSLDNARHGDLKQQAGRLVQSLHFALLSVMEHRSQRR